MDGSMTGINPISFRWMQFYSWKITEVEETRSYGTPSNYLRGCLKHYSTEESLD
jgi:hypothetical protein